jgi:hypothetical protein
MIADLKRVASEMKVNPTKRQYTEQGRYHAYTLRDRFGTWEKALEKAGLVKKP